ncbi:glycosyltransferase family 2 protein [Acinetobacter cumulans]|nr:glycosyltransferase family 2 protein [Acinetobacter cumulans]
MTKNFLSIVIPLYNKQNSIRRAIESVLVQSYQNFEIIIVNDGSTDDSLLEVERIKDPRITLISINNSGVAFARNLGIDKARSKYVCLLDGDDEYYTEFLAEINKMISVNSNCSLYSCRYEVVDSKGHLKIGNLSLEVNYFGIVSDFYKEYSRSRSLVCSSSVCINKDLFNKVGGFPVGKKTGEDIYVWLNLNLLAPTFFSSKILSLIHQDAENRTNTRVQREVPYHLYYYLFLNFDSADKRIISYCYKSSVIQSVDALFNRNIHVFNLYLNMFKEKFYSTYIFLKFLRFFPVRLISIVKNIRDKITVKVKG